MSYSLTFFIVLLSYFLGCCTMGYYLVRLLAGQDIRHSGSGSVGARNVGRMLGFGAALSTFGADAAKGALAVWLAILCNLDAWGITAALLAVVAGHIWPLQLGFHGGKGIATSAGGLLVLDPQLLTAVLLLCLFLWALSRHFIWSGLLAVTVSPLMALSLQRPLPLVLGLVALAVLVLVAHRSHFRPMSRQRGSTADRTRPAP